MSAHATYMLFYSANLAYIVTHLYSWLLKWYYKPKAYSERFHELFPAQKAVGYIYLLQVLHSRKRCEWMFHVVLIVQDIITY